MVVGMRMGDAALVGPAQAAPPTKLEGLENYAKQHGVMLAAGAGLLGYGFYADSSLAKWAGAGAIGYVAFPIVALLVANAWSSRPMSADELAAARAAAPRAT